MDAEMEERERASRLTAELKTGDSNAAAELLPLVYDELHRMASRHFRSQRRDHTLQPTALVHEAFLKLVNQPRAEFEDRAHFFAVASIAMRQVLMNHAEKRAARKRGGDNRRVQLPDALPAILPDDCCDDLVALDAALRRLAERNARKSRVVEMRYFGGLTMEQIACVLDVSLSTIESDWRMARAWLSREMRGPNRDNDGP